MSRLYAKTLAVRAIADTAQAVMGETYTERLVRFATATLGLLTAWVYVHFWNPQSSLFADAQVGAGLGLIVIGALVFFGLLLNLLFVTPGRLWKEERERAEIAEESVRARDEIESNATRLKIEFQQLFYGAFIDKFPDRSPLVVIVTVRNEGNRPSSATGWKVAVSVGPHHLVLEPEAAHNVTMGGKTGAPLRLIHEDNIAVKTHKPVPVGGVETGYLFTVLPVEVARLVNETTVITVTCEQADGRPAELVWRIGDGVPAERTRFIPGMTSPFDKEDVK